MMRIYDIAPSPHPAGYESTEGMYLPVNSLNQIPAEEMTADELRRGLCQKSRGNVKVCVTCPGGCRWGWELVRRMENENSL